MEYRTATEAQLLELARMRWDFLGEGSEEVPAVSQADFVKSCVEFLAQGLAGGDWTYWIAERQGEIVSHIFVRTIRSVPRPCSLNDRWGYVTNVYTRPAWRNKSIGTELMNAVKRWATEQDMELLIVSPSEESTTFYSRAGFVPETDFMQLRLRPY